MQAKIILQIFRKIIGIILTFQKVCVIIQLLMGKIFDFEKEGIKNAG